MWKLDKPINGAGLAIINEIIRRRIEKIRMSGIPSGCILIWSGAADAVPEGWALCDGSNGTPDLRGRFVLGSTTEFDEEGNTAHPMGEAGGEEEVVLTEDQMPIHSHEVLDSDGNSLASNIAGSVTYRTQMATRTVSSSSGRIIDLETTKTGSGMAHNNMPPYYALCYIMKL